MDRFDRAVAWILSGVTVIGVTVILSREWYVLSWLNRIGTLCAGLLLIRYLWIPNKWRGKS